MVKYEMLRPDRYREFARQLRVLAFKRIDPDLCRRDQILALAKGFDRFADRLEGVEPEKAAAD